MLHDRAIRRAVAFGFVWMLVFAVGCVGAYLLGGACSPYEDQDDAKEVR